MSRSIHNIIETEAEAIKKIPTENIKEAVQLILSAQVIGAKVVVSGMGKAGHIGHNIAMTLCSTGIPAVFLHPAEAQHGDLGIIQECDVLLLLSNSGKTREVIELAELAFKLHIGLHIILIGGDLGSVELINLVDVFLPTGNPNEVCPLGLTPTTSTTVMTVIGDIIVCKLMEKIGFTKEDYAKRHHGGYLGHKSRDI